MDGVTSNTPLIAASFAGSPPSYFWKIFSAITTPSSTRIPITRIRPNKDSILMFTPKKGATINIPAIEIGMLSATQKAILGFRNKPRNNRTSKIPLNPFSSNRSVLCCIPILPSRSKYA